MGIKKHGNYSFDRLLNLIYKMLSPTVIVSFVPVIHFNALESPMYVNVYGGWEIWKKYQILKTKWTNGLIKLQNQLQVMGNGRKTG